jgi:hypothetical protein
MIKRTRRRASAIAAVGLTVFSLMEINIFIDLSGLQCVICTEDKMLRSAGPPGLEHGNRDDGSLAEGE